MNEQNAMAASAMNEYGFQTYTFPAEMEERTELHRIGPGLLQIRPGHRQQLHRDLQACSSHARQTCPRRPVWRRSVDCLVQGPRLERGQRPAHGDDWRQF